MVVKLTKKDFYSLRDPANLYRDMLRDVELLYQQSAFTSCITLIVCFIDTLATGSGKAKKSKYTAFMEKQFKVLCNELRVAVPSKQGSVTFYEQFRNGLAHIHGPKTGYALARNNETGGKYIEIFEVDQYGRYVGINVDRLYAEFVELLKKIESIKI